MQMCSESPRLPAALPRESADGCLLRCATEAVPQPRGHACRPSAGQSWGRGRGGVVCGCVGVACAYLVFTASTVDI